MLARFSELLADATQGATPGQINLIIACAVIAAGYALARTAYFLLRQPAEPVAAPAPVQAAPVSVPAVAPVLEPAPVAMSGVDAKLVAILTAAAVAATGKGVVVKRITFINHNTISGWAEAGRLSIQTSHNIRRNG